MSRKKGIISAVITFAQVFILAIVMSLSHGVSNAKAAGDIQITGTVVNPSGVGVDDVSVYATDPGGDTVDYGPVTTATDGTYDLTVEAGTYDFHFDPPSGSNFSSVINSDVTVVSDQVMNVQLTLSPPAMYTISGYITDGSNTPISGLTVSLGSKQADTEEGATGTYGATATTDSTGFYSVNVPAASDWQMEVSPGNSFSGGTFPNDFVLTASQSIDNSGGDVTQSLQVNTSTVTVNLDDANGLPITDGANVIGIAGGNITVPTSEGSETFNAIEDTSSESGNLSVNTGTSGTATFYSFTGLTYPAVTTSTQNTSDQMSFSNEKLCVVGDQVVCAQTPLPVNGNTSITFQELLPTPTNLSAPSPTNQYPALTWSVVSGASYYNIYRNGTDIGSSSTNSFTDANAPTGTNTYYVTAVSEAGVESPPSNTINVTYNPTVAPTITSASSASTGMRQPFSFTVTTTGTPTATLSESGSLPSGLSFTGNGNGTATLAGTAATGTNGTYDITITATNSAGTYTQHFVLTVTTSTSAPTITSANSVTVEYGVSMTPFTVTTNGYPAPSLTETSPLPSGLNFHNNGNGTATISGTPSGNAEGPTTITIKATNSAGSTTQTFTIYVDKIPTFSSIPNNELKATVGDSYSLTVTATGYPVPAMTESGALPTGITFTDNGNGTATISGTPTSGTGGTYSVTLTATNSSGAVNDTFTITVDQAPAITSGNNVTVNFGTAMSPFTVTTTGYPVPSLTANGLPSGLNFHNNSNGTATISGTPSGNASGVYTITITASNGIGSNATQTFTITVDRTPTITSSNSATAVTLLPFSFQVTTNGYPAPTYSLSGTLPSGLSFNTSTGVISGTPSLLSIGIYNLTITATNSLGTTNQSVELTVL